jgi:photosystem II stability/assembly factor-like uncharacterized protein
MMEKILVYLFVLSATATTLYGQWQIVNEGEKGGYYSVIDFVSDDVGWMSGINNFYVKRLFKTEDFGETWSVVDIMGVENPNVIGVDFLSEEVGWILIEEEMNEKILLTQDGGKTWQLKLNTTSELDHIFAIDDQNLYGWHWTGKIIKTNDGGTTWIKVFDEKVRIRSMWFLNSEVGVVIGENDPTGFSTTGAFTALTLDGGQTWEKQNLDFDGVSNLKFINDSTGYFIASGTYANGGGMYLCETKDTGSTWSVKYKNEYLGAYAFLSSDTVYAIMSDSLINNGNVAQTNLMMSADGGTSWKKIQPVLGYSIYFNKKNQGLITTNVLPGVSSGLGRTALRSNDKGKSWQVLTMTHPFRSAFFLNKNKGFLVSAGYAYSDIIGLLGGSIFVSNDGGQSWNVSYNESSLVKSLRFVSESTGFFIEGENQIDKTSDGGNNWNVVNENGTNLSDFVGNDLFFRDENTGWIVGSDSPFNPDIAEIFYTTNGGTNWDLVWEKTDHNTDGNFYSGLKSVFVINSTIWAVGQYGLIVKSVAPDSFVVVNSNTELDLSNVFFRDENHGWIAGWSDEYGFNIPSFLLKTSDGGESWQKIKFDKYLISDTYFEDILHGWAVGRDTAFNGVILETFDGGNEWSVQVEGLVAPLNGLDFKDGSGWAVGDNGLVLKIDGVTGVKENPVAISPNTFSLSQNYPNPFNPTTKIKYTISQQSYVTLKVYDVLGNEVTTLVNEEKPAGIYELTWSTENLSSGVYFYQLHAQNFSETKKMILLR